MVNNLKDFITRYEEEEKAPRDDDGLKDQAIEAIEEEGKA